MSNLVGKLEETQLIYAGAILALVLEKRAFLEKLKGLMQKGQRSVQKFWTHLKHHPVNAHPISKPIISTKHGYK